MSRNSLKVKGKDLTAADRLVVLSKFSNRYTGDHKPDWVHQGFRRDKYPLQFISDDEWLANTSFYVTADYLLDSRYGVCDSVPTWPNNPELQGTPRCVWAYHGENFRYKGWQRDHAQWVAAGSERSLTPTAVQHLTVQDIRGHIYGQNLHRSLAGLPVMTEDELFLFLVNGLQEDWYKTHPPATERRTLPDASESATQLQKTTEIE